MTRVGAPRRWLAVGDPQSTPERFFSFLDRYDALSEDGGLAKDVGLLSIGDHFDYGTDAASASRDGLAILRWLSEQPADCIVLIAGNHDLCRVIELAHETDDSFAAAREAAFANDPSFSTRFPHIPTPLIAMRDFNGFTVAQRTLVQSLLLQRRFALAAIATVNGHRAVVVHAGVSARELELLGILHSREPERIARALNTWLDDRVARVSSVWRSGHAAPLDLEPLHFGGGAGVEGSGFLYQRPVNPAVVPAGGDRPRRLDARELPRDLLQIVGHTGHKKSREELGDWVTPAAKRVEFGGGLRTLQIAEVPTYELGLLPHRAGAATMIMIDAGMSDSRVGDYPLLPLSDVAVPR